jgi:HTH-type transcriptional regulator/antitoxin HigA
MEIRMIHNKSQYKAALEDIEKLWNAPPKSDEVERLNVLSLLVEHYEKTHFPISDPDPIEFIEHIMDARGLTPKDLEPVIGHRGRVADILNRTRPLTLKMIRRLVSQLKLPAEVLVRPYALREEFSGA